MTIAPITRCPRCREASSPLAVSYTPAREGSIDWSDEVFVVCPCGHGYLIVASDVIVAAVGRSALRLGRGIVGDRIADFQ